MIAWSTLQFIHMNKNTTSKSLVRQIKYIYKYTYLKPHTKSKKSTGKNGNNVLFKRQRSLFIRLNSRNPYICMYTTTMTDNYSVKAINSRLSK